MNENKKISIMGVRGAGKTCYIYAMAQVMQAGARNEDTVISMISNSIIQQTKLNSGYSMLARNEWPGGTADSSSERIYDFRVRLEHTDNFRDVIPSLLVRDYRGGVLTGDVGMDDFSNLLNFFSDSCSVIFLIDGSKLLNAMDVLDLEPEHRVVRTPMEILEARNQISFIENLFLEYRKNNSDKKIPPVMVAITKADLFASKEELAAGKKLVRRYLSSIFAKGTGVDSAITAVSLGDNLTHEDGDRLTGNLKLNMDGNIHIPIIYSLYAYLDSEYDRYPKERQAFIDSVLASLRDMLSGRVDMYGNGYPVFQIR